jgi:hypothetical protein
MFDEILTSLLASVDKYFAETPKDVIDKELKAIDQMQFSGPTAKDYFTSFHQQTHAITDPLSYSKFVPKHPTASQYMIFPVVEQRPFINSHTKKYVSTIKERLSQIASPNRLEIKTYNIIHIPDEDYPSSIYTGIEHFNSQKRSELCSIN